MLEHGEVVFSLTIRYISVWEPSPCLAGVIDRIEAMRLESGLPPTGTVIDIGCGSGRDIIFLAQRGWKAIGVDNNPDYLAKAQLLAKRYGTSIDVKLLDVETHSAALAAVTDQVDLLNVARYLDRALMPVLRYGPHNTYSCGPSD
jgi:SAM-dependent methyltransferase